jgi:membrane protein DedA with SNARE-associated domain
MDYWLVDLLEWMQTVAPLWVYAALLFVAYLENVVPPIPGDMVIVFGGYLAGMGHVSFVIVVILGTVGGLLGFMTMYYLGRRFGDVALDPDRMRWLPKARIYRARRWLWRWGYILVAANRFLSGLRSVISLTVGAARMNARLTAGFALFSAFVWTLTIAYAGMLLGENWDEVSVYLSQYGRFVLAIIALLVLWQMILAIRARRRPEA